ncbi:MAG: hypothetical protein HRU38_11710 [Saccharospirillaceae bacterium]|nr:hypothetical protein [Pseudomonadales bacterium]NRB79314.1 hypothetical protein [Saccharospirillaceae bacterium]
MKIKSTHPYVIAWHYIILLSAILAFYLWPQEVIDHRLKAFLAVLIVMSIGFVHIVFVFEKDPFKAKQPLFEFDIKIPGWLKLIWEVSLFSAATWIYAQNQTELFLQFYITAIILLYLFSWDRTWLMVSSIYRGK